MKRLFDVICAIVALILLLPVLIVTALIIHFTLGGAIFFIQERIGLNDKTIRLFKFRSMTNDTDMNGDLLPNHMRVTKFGRFIRKTSLDELPSLFNVLRGELSLVGPRPLLVSYLPYYKLEHRIRHTVKPGITGLAQVNGRNATTWQRRLDFDSEYVKNRDFMLDIKILFLTFYKVIKSEGVEGQNDLSIIPLPKDKSYLGNEHD